MESGNAIAVALVAARGDALVAELPAPGVQLFIKSDVGLRLIARDGTSFFTREMKVESSGRVLAAELLTVEPGQRYTVTFDAADAAQAELAVVRIRKGRLAEHVIRSSREPRMAARRSTDDCVD